MAYITKRGNSYSVRYTYEDEHGKSCDKWESFPTQERRIWEVEEMRAALDSMEDPILHLAVHLTLVGALREGEIVGLTPEDLDFDAVGTQHHFPHPEKHQNRILLPYHLHDLCSERGTEEVAESAGGRRDERPDTLP